MAAPTVVEAADQLAELVGRIPVGVCTVGLPTALAEYRKARAAAAEAEDEAWDAMPVRTRARLAAWREVEGSISGYAPAGYAFMIDNWPDVDGEPGRPFSCSEDPDYG